MKFYIGVIEDRHDPEQTGRFRVRVLGLHTEDKVLLPTVDLPWATVLSPNGANSGLGNTPPFYVHGTWVYLSYRDDDKQEPLIHGALAGKPVAVSSPTLGFNDPDGVYPKLANESDVHELARGSLTAVNAVRRDELKVSGIATADFDGISTENSASGAAVPPSDGGSFDMPSIVADGFNIGTYRPEYPFNKVFASESGHVLEFDDTEDYRRVQLSHAAGSYMEYSDDGTLVMHSISDKYDVVNSKLFTAVGGDEVHSTDGSLKVFANKSLTSGNNYDIEVGAGANINIMVRSGDMNMHILGNVNQSIDGDFNVSCDNFTIDASRTAKITSRDMKLVGADSVDIDGGTIDLN